MNTKYNIQKLTLKALVKDRRKKSLKRPAGEGKSPPMTLCLFTASEDIQCRSHVLPPPPPAWQRVPELELVQRKPSVWAQDI